METLIFSAVAMPESYRGGIATAIVDVEAMSQMHGREPTERSVAHGMRAGART